MEFRYCPHCAAPLAEKDGRLACLVGCRKYVHWNNPIPVVAALMPSVPGVLLVQRALEPEKGRWCLPCGFVNQNEGPEEACKREVKEETGLEVDIIRPLETRKPPEYNQLLIVYLIRTIGKEQKPKAGDDAEKVQYFCKAELPDICFSIHKEVVLNYYMGRYSLKSFRNMD